MWIYIKYVDELKFYGMSNILFQHNVLKECITRNIQGIFCTSISWKMMTINSIFILNFRNNLKFPNCHDNVLITSIFFVYCLEISLILFFFCKVSQWSCCFWHVSVFEFSCRTEVSKLLKHRTLWIIAGQFLIVEN